jgi:cellulose synthase/poly-beta-1,6-N-acetylglucosamine synthase-like glycosyltransferase
MSTGEPTCTVVLNTYNRASVLPRALSSVLAQTLTSFEVIVVDDGSTDDTASVIGGFSDQRIRYVHQANAGLSLARNRGAAEAKGRFVTFLDDDDRVEPTWLERFAGAFGDDACGIACCGLTMLDVDGQRIDSMLPADMGGAWDHVEGLFFSGSFAVDRQLLLDVGGYAPEMTCSHQTELSLRLVPACLARGQRVVPIRETLLILERRAPSERPMANSQRLAIGSRILVDRHRDRLRRSPEMLGYFLAIGGVNSARLGDYREARRLLWGAIKANPRFAKNYLRLGVALLPPLGDRLWRSSRYRGGVAGEGAA